MPKAIQEIIDLIDMRIKIHTDALEIPYIRGKTRRKGKLEELEYVKETILLAYEEQEVAYVQNHV